MKSLEKQIGGDHYKKMKIQPWQIIDAFELDYYSGTAVAYILRAGRKGDKKDDILKAIHTLEHLAEKL